MRFLALLLLMLPAAAAAQERLVVRREVCAQLAQLPPSADAEYRPGVDARGRPVTPADLSSGGGPRFEEFSIEIDVDLRRRFGVPADRRLFQGEVKLGSVVVRGGNAF